MKRFLIDRARQKKSLKRSGDRESVPLDEAVKSPDSAPLSDDLIDLDEALGGLSKKDQMKADLVKLRYFAGLTGEEAAIDEQDKLATSNTGLNIGCGPNLAPGRFFCGLIDDARICNRPAKS